MLIASGGKALESCHFTPNDSGFYGPAIRFGIVRNLQFAVSACHIRGCLSLHHLNCCLGKRGALVDGSKGLGLQYRAALQPDD